MPKARNSKVDEALALYRQGLKPIEISRKLDIPEGTVKTRLMHARKRMETLLREVET
jgi:DNA-directed RNA polymerase specialized sigma24 family protein